MLQFLVWENEVTAVVLSPIYASSLVLLKPAFEGSESGYTRRGEGRGRIVPAAIPLDPVRVVSQRREEANVLIDVRKMEAYTAP